MLYWWYVKNDTFTKCHIFSYADKFINTVTVDYLAVLWTTVVAKLVIFHYQPEGAYLQNIMGSMKWFNYLDNITRNGTQ